MGGNRRAISYRNLVGENARPLPDSDHGFSPAGPYACDLRINLVKKHGLGGVMVWDYGHDSEDPADSLLNHLTKNITAPPPPSEANPQ